MRFYASTRCIIVYLFMTIIVVHSQDLFDIFHDIKDQVDHASTKIKDTVMQHVLKVVRPIHQYLLLLMKSFHFTERRRNLSGNAHD